MMLDNELVSVALDEIGLEGTRGITLNNLCERLEYRVDPEHKKKFKIDEDTKKFLLETLQGFSPDFVTIEAADTTDFGNTVLCGSIELRRRALDIPVNMPLTDPQYTLLEAIGRSREKGVLQAKLIGEVKTDAKNVHYNIEQLIVYGLM